MEFQVEKTETEFNSSIATLMRIDRLIKEIHSLRRGIMPINEFGMPIRTGNPSELYIDTLFDLYSEIQTKMKDKEIEESKKHKEQIDKTYNGYGTNLHLPTISMGVPTHDYRNPAYYIGWKELHSLTDEYFIFLMRTADSHGMLMSNKDDAGISLK